MPEAHRSRFPSRPVRALLFLVLLAGCNSRPSAPRLEDGPVYWSQRQGFRFSVPSGWKQRARGEVPSGTIKGERMLVEYKCMNCSGTLMISVADVPLYTPLGEYITKNNLTGDKWRQRGPVEDFTINGVPAARITYLQGSGKFEQSREIVAFRRDERVYFFKGFSLTGDATSRKALRAAVDTIVW